jgi:hypothetical protein
MAEDEFSSMVYSRGAWTVTIDRDKQVPTEGLFREIKGGN